MHTAHVTLEEVNAVYDRLIIYGNELQDEGEIPLNVAVFQLFYSWAVKRVRKQQKGLFSECLPDVYEWIWLQSGQHVIDHRDDGSMEEIFLVHGELDQQANFVAKSKVMPIPDYTNSINSACLIRDVAVTATKLTLQECDGSDLYPLWQATLHSKSGRIVKQDAITPAVAILKSVCRMLLDEPSRLNFQKLGPCQHYSNRENVR